MANPEYPNEKPEDFAESYDPEVSDIPWRTFENCSVCGRIAAEFNAEHARFPALFDPYNNKRIQYQICSSACEVKLLKWHLDLCDRFHKTPVAFS